MKSSFVKVALVAVAFSGIVATAQAMPAMNGAVAAQEQNSLVEKTRYVCGPYGCVWRPNYYGWGGGYYRPRPRYWGAPRYGWGHRGWGYRGGYRGWGHRGWRRW